MRRLLFRHSKPLSLGYPVARKTNCKSLHKLRSRRLIHPTKFGKVVAAQGYALSKLEFDLSRHNMNTDFTALF